jgi:hypothetical protein
VLKAATFYPEGAFGLGRVSAENKAPRSKPPTRQSRYGDGALRSILAKVNKNKNLSLESANMSDGMNVIG